LDERSSEGVVSNGDCGVGVLLAAPFSGVTERMQGGARTALPQ